MKSNLTAAVLFPLTFTLISVILKRESNTYEGDKYYHPEQINHDKILSSNKICIRGIYTIKPRTKYCPFHFSGKIKGISQPNLPPTSPLSSNDAQDLLQKRQFN